MKKYLERDSNTITISQFYENHKLKKYNYDPPCQRNSVWNVEKKSFLIDSILKNYPIPPVFFRQIIDTATGITKYEVIDGKQRLQSIVSFIDNKIPLPNDFGIGDYGNEELNGLYFKDLEKYSEYKKSFWKYSISIEYLYTDSDSVIDSVFDRLNRNGEPLTSQELRKAKYHDTYLLKIVNRLSNTEFWKERLKNLDIIRMEDKEFVSEILFTIVEGDIIESSATSLNTLYEKYSQKKFELKLRESVNLFEKVTTFLNDLDLDYNEYKITGVSHLYGLWCFSRYCVINNIDTKNVINKINRMYTLLRKRVYKDESIKQYKKSMESRTRSKSQRKNRLDALLSYCKV